MKKHDFLGFTLAEVLITIAIIGVVAVLVIPTLVAHNQQKGWDTAAQVFEAKMEEALRVMNTQQILAGYKTTEAFLNELSKNIKITKICSNDNILACFEDKVYWGAKEEEVDMSTITLSAHLGQKGWGTKVHGVQFANGTTGVIAYNAKCVQDPYNNQFSPTSCISLLYDTSGFANPNTSKKDLRSINVNSLGSKNCVVEIGKTCFGTMFRPTSISVEDCEKKKGELGIENCALSGSNYNFWAGAVEACGGIEYMPSPEQLAEIANYVYNTKGIAAHGTTNNLTLDYAKLSSLGLTVNAGGSLYVWTNTEMDGSTCAGPSCTRVFGPTSYTNRTGAHSNSDRRAICVAK